MAVFLFSPLLMFLPTRMAEGADVHVAYLRQGWSGLFELLCLSRRANKERVARARPAAQNHMPYTCYFALIDVLTNKDLQKKHVVLWQPYQAKKFRT